MDKVDLAAKLALFETRWDPKIVGELNGQQVKLAKLEGAFDWHHHEREDELFLVLAGRLEMELRDRTITLGPGELLIVPAGTEHRPVAPVETHVLLFEPASTLNTGTVETERTVREPERI
ncbi:MAG TPA: cupin domain-containing protein [Thermoanaerobaculia bacterium]|nr:cupin domain-containing protein [Thermoanaerobaculia bacterium]